jgi:MFS family permease
MDTSISPHTNIGSKRWLVILPAAFLMYTISFFDRVNIGMALPYIAKELKLDSVEAGWIGAAFAWGYIVTQLGGGYLALKFGARRLIGICLVLFGAASCATGLASSFTELAAFRILLGLAEGPIYVATSMFLAQWFMKSERGRAFGLWNLAVPAGAFLAGPISGAILTHYDWRVMMMAEGLPAWIFAAIWFLAIPKSFDAANWLSEPDREIIRANLATEQATYRVPEVDPWWSIFTEPAVWFLTIGFALNGVLLYGTTLWLPTIMKSYGQLSPFAIGLYSGAPFIASMVGIWYISDHSDKHHQERRLHAAVPTALTGVFMIAAAFVPDHVFYLQIALFVILGFTLKMLNPMVFARLTEVLPMRKAVPAVAVVSGLGNFIGQFAGPLIVGYVKSASRDFFWSLLVLGMCALLGGLAIALSKTKDERRVPSHGSIVADIDTFTQ